MLFKDFQFLRLDLGQGLKRVNFSFEVKGRLIALLLKMDFTKKYPFLST